MKLRTPIITAAGIALLVPLAGSVIASEDDAVRCGRDLMTSQEFAEHRAAMRTMNAEQRETYRQAHHEAMKERAAAEGITLPDEPLARGRGLGPRLAATGNGRPCPGPGFGRHHGRFVDD